MDVALVIITVAVALIFGYTNGFHDASGAIATSVATRALAPRIALMMTAAMNFVGALLGTGIAVTIGSRIVEVSADDGVTGIVVVLAALLGAMCWNVVTWWFGLPSSSSHALIGGLAGAGLAAAFTVHWDVIGALVIVPMFIAPAAGFVLALLLMKAIAKVFHNAPRKQAMRRFQAAQTISAAAVALGHGLQDTQKIMGVIAIALVAGGYHDDTSIPLWVKLSAAAAISAGTYAGGWRIIKTVGTKISPLNPAQGFAAETVSAGILYTTAFVFAAPISTTHTVVASVVGVGAATRRSAVRWNTAGSIVGAWLITPLASGTIASVLALLLSQLT